MNTYSEITKVDQGIDKHQATWNIYKDDTDVVQNTFSLSSKPHYCKWIHKPTFTPHLRVKTNANIFMDTHAPNHCLILLCIQGHGAHG